MSEVTFAQVRRLARRLRSRRASVREAAEAELRAIGSAAAECWAAHVREDREWHSTFLRTLSWTAVLLLLLAVAAEPFAQILGVLAGPFLGCAVLYTWGRDARSVMSNHDALRLCMAVHHPLMLDPLLLALKRNGRRAPAEASWAACERALNYFVMLPDEEASSCVANHRAVLVTLLREAYFAAGTAAEAESVDRTLLLIALFRRVTDTAALPDFERLTAVRPTGKSRQPLYEAAVECTQHLREVREQRRRNETLLRPASAPADATLLRPAGPPRDADADLLLRPSTPEDAP
jgi:hypothetical protein